MSIEIENKKNELMKFLSSIDDISILNEIADFMNARKNDWWFDLSEEEKKSIEKGILDANAGRLKPNSEAKKMYEKWLSN